MPRTRLPTPAASAASPTAAGASWSASPSSSAGRGWLSRKGRGPSVQAGACRSASGGTPRARTECLLGSLARHLLEELGLALLHLLRGQILLAGGDRPGVAEGIVEGAETVPPE